MLFATLWAQALASLDASQPDILKEAGSPAQIVTAIYALFVGLFFLGIDYLIKKFRNPSTESPTHQPTLSAFEGNGIQSFKKAGLNIVAERLRMKHVDPGEGGILNRPVKRKYHPQDHELHASYASIDKLIDSLLEGKRRGFRLEGGSATGKSTALLRATQHALEMMEPRNIEIYLPLFVEFGEIKAKLLAALAEQKVELGATDETAMARFIRTALRDCIESLRKGFEFDRDRVTPCLHRILILDGFDDLTEGVECADTINDACIVVLKELSHDYGLVISSRPEPSDCLAALPLDVFVFEDALSIDIETFLVRAFPNSPELVTHVALLDAHFKTVLKSRMLYFKPMCQAWVDSRKLEDRFHLLQSELRAPFDHNRSKSLVAKADERIERKALQFLGHIALGDPCLSKDQLISAIQYAGGIAQPSQLTCLKTHLIENVQNRDFGFEHNDFRDYWIAADVVDWLFADNDLPFSFSETSNEPITREKRLRVVLGEFESPILELICGHLRFSAQEGGHCKKLLRARRRLIALIAGASETPSPNRDAPSLCGAALTLYLRVQAVLDDLRDPDASAEVGSAFSGKCFERIDGRQGCLDGLNLVGCCFRDSDLRGCSFRWANLANADLDNADLRGADFTGCSLEGANLQNAQFGTFDNRREFKGTNFSGARLEGANWFNVRVPLEGLLLLWCAAPKAGGREIFVGTSKGRARFIRLDNSNRYVHEIDFEHRLDVLDIDVDEEGGRLATASRDGSVRIFKMKSTWVGRSVELIESIPIPGYYPRAVQFSATRHWLAICDRHHYVFFRSLGRTISEGSFQHTRKGPYKQHSGPIMCLDGYRVGDADVFFTTGYDGRVVRWDAPSVTGKEWRATVLVKILQHSASKKPDILRALAVVSTSADCAPFLLVGGEGRSLYRVDIPISGVSANAVKVAEFPSGIFSVAIDGEYARLAVGLSDGTTHLLDTNCGKDEEWRTIAIFGKEDDDIVRGLVFTGGPDRNLLIVKWTGQVSLCSLATEFREIEVHDYAVDEPPEPSRDIGKLRFDAGSSKGISNLPCRVTEYLASLHK